MLILSFEQSTPSAGITLLADGEIRATHTWHEPRKRDQHLFAALPDMLAASGVSIQQLDRIAVGLGPGSFSGVRIAIAAASAMALPDQIPIAGINSAAALAWQITEETGASTVAVLGDARRQRLWMATFTRESDHQILTPLQELSLIPADELTARLPAACCVVSPDWSRLETQLTPLGDTGRVVIAEPRFPSATDIAQLAAVMPDDALKTPLNPPEPLYLHPAVFIPPRFPASQSVPSGGISPIPL